MDINRTITKPLCLRHCLYRLILDYLLDLDIVLYETLNIAVMQHQAYCEHTSFNSSSCLRFRFNFFLEISDRIFKLNFKIYHDSLSYMRLLTRLIISLI